MRCPLFRIAMRAGLAVLLLLGGAARVTLGQVQNVRGSYGGFALRDDAPESPDLTALNLAQSQRRLAGTFVGNPDLLPEQFQVQGAISAAGNLNLEGKSSLRKMVLRGGFEEFEGGAAYGDGHARFPGDPRLPGLSIVLLRDAVLGPDDPPPDGEGTFHGEAVSAVDDSEFTWELDAERREDSPTGFDGHVRILNNESLRGIIVHYRSTVNAAGDLVLIGAGSGFLLRVEGLLQATLAPAEQPARIEGAFEFRVPGEGTLVDFGTFALERAAFNVPEPK